MKARVLGETFNIHRPKTSVPVFIRYGMFSTRERSFNHATGMQELGLSVYRGVLEGDAVRLLYPDDPCSILNGQGRLCFCVTGREVGYGSDGEPVLRGVRMLPYAIALGTGRT